ncbi:uncharacterized protein LOC129611338 [Condylostylus longicornis]|uniref:uncharacterized protein LOC129611338 n=1 Tax=Condylostylus longicornis TaxID=2530218 RepID=UPI00244E0338|nr:uncharacterized protein LOC129611338 [Condylostylus longicornis]
MLKPVIFRQINAELRKIFISSTFYQNTNFYSRQYSSQPISMAYNEYGTAEQETGTLPLIIMHGLLGSKNNWRGMSKALSSKFKPSRKIYALDARNHGESPHTNVHDYESMSSDLSFFLQEKNIKKAVLMGHSMGGRAMMYFALKYPDLVDRAIILDISPIDVPRDFFQMKNLFIAMVTAEVTKGTPLPKARSIVEAHIRSAIKDDAPYDFILQNLKKTEDGSIIWAPNVKLLLDNLEIIGSFPSNILKSHQYKGPTLFIAGSKSNFLNPDHWPEIQLTFPNSHLVWLDCGHLVHFEQPQQFIENVSKFMNE